MPNVDRPMNLLVQHSRRVHPWRTSDAQSRVPSPERQHVAQGGRENVQDHAGYRPTAFNGDAFEGACAFATAARGGGRMRTSERSQAKDPLLPLESHRFTIGCLLSH